MSKKKQMMQLLNAARQKTADVLGDAGTNIMQVASEVSEDCDNEVLRNARAFYSGAVRKAGNGIRASIRAAEELSLEDSPKTARENLSDSFVQMKETVKEVAEDCDNEVLQNAREFYSGAIENTRNSMENKAQETREKRKRRKAARAAARQRRAAVRSKLFSKAGVVLVCLILFAALLISGALWISRHHGTGTENHTEAEVPGQPQAEAELLNWKNESTCFTRDSGFVHM